MPNYGLVINSRFRPFSYQEMLAPVAQATQAHQALEDAYSELEMKANTLETVLNKERDPELYQQYREYIDALGSVSDELARNGLTPTSRQMASNLRGRYASDIVPIQAAAERRAAIAKAQRDALMKDPTTLFSGRAAETNLKEFYDNPTLDFENYSGALLAKQVSDQASSIAKQLTDLKTGKLDTYTNTLTQQLGLTPAQLQAAIKDPTNAYYGTVINAIVDNVMQSSGIPTWGNYNNIKNQALGYAREGLYSAIGEQRLSTYANKAAELATQHANAMAQLREQYRLKGKEEERKALANAKAAGAIVPLRSQREMQDAAKEIAKYKKYFYQNADGTWSMTKEGFDNLYYDWSDYSGYTSAPEGSIGNTGHTAYAPTEFGRFMTRLNGGKPLVQVKKDGNGYEAIAGTGPRYRGNLWNNFMNQNSEDYFDIYTIPEVDIPIDSPYQDDLTANVMRNIKSGQDIEAVDFDPKKKKWVTTGDDYTKKDLAGYKVTAIRPSSYGMTAFLHKDGEEDIRILVPEGVNVANLNAVQSNMQELTRWMQATYSPYEPLLDANGYIQYDAAGNVLYTTTPMTPERRQQYLNAAEQIKAQMLHDAITIGRPATAETDKQ